MAESAFVVLVPAAEPYVGALRERFDPVVKLGVPAHITVLFPFLSPECITPEILRRASSAIRRVERFEFTLTGVGRFPATAYWIPEPVEPFVSLTTSMCSEFPQHPPYGGAFSTIVPHLTIADHDATYAEIAARELANTVARSGPVRARCTSVTLLENSTGRWQPFHEFPLA